MLSGGARKLIWEASTMITTRISLPQGPPVLTINSGYVVPLSDSHNGGSLLKSNLRHHDNWLFCSACFTLRSHYHGCRSLVAAVTVIISDLESDAHGGIERDNWSSHPQ